MASPRSLPGQHFIMRFMERLGYKSSVAGFCFGISMMAIQALVLNELNVFDARLWDLFLAFQSQLPLTIDMLAFLEGVQLNQQPWLYADLFANAQPYFQSPLFTMIFTQSQALQQQSLTSIKSFSGAYTLAGLRTYFATLLKAVEESDDLDHPVTMLLRTHDHAITVAYNKKEQNWIIIDSAHEVKSVKCRSIDDIAASVHKAFAESPRCIFSTSMYSTAKNARTTIKIRDKWHAQVEFKQLHEITRMNANDVDSLSASRLTVAVREADEKLVKVLLENGADTNQMTDSFETPLMLAATQNDMVIISSLLAHGAQVDLSAQNGETALLYAAQSGALNSIEILLKTGANPNVGRVRENGLETALYTAIINKHPVAVKLLLDGGADPNLCSRNEGVSPLGLAAWIGEVDCVRHLLEHGADISIGRPKYQKTPLMLARHIKHNEIINLLLAAGAEPQQCVTNVVIPRLGFFARVKQKLSKQIPHADTNIIRASVSRVI